MLDRTGKGSISLEQAIFLFKMVHGQFFSQVSNIISIIELRYVFHVAVVLCPFPRLPLLTGKIGKLIVLLWGKWQKKLENNNR